LRLRRTSLRPALRHTPRAPPGPLARSAGAPGGGASLLKYFHFVRVHRRAGKRHVIVDSQPVHPARALDRWLIRRNQWDSREIEHVSAAGLVSRRCDGAAHVDALSVVPCIHSRKRQCQVSSHSSIAAPIRACAPPAFAGGFDGSRNLRFSGFECVPAAWLHRSSRTTAPGQQLQNLAVHCYDV
jgi:hypothetical protein